jgi:hypothetical protein
LTVVGSVPERVQTPVPLVTSRLKMTGLPDAPPVADRTDDPATIPDEGAVQLIVWAGRFTTRPAVAHPDTAGWLLASPE